MMGANNTCYHCFLQKISEKSYLPLLSAALFVKDPYSLGVAETNQRHEMLMSTNKRAFSVQFSYQAVPLQSNNREVFLLTYRYTGWDVQNSK